jgi:hypothetical protein
VKNSTAYNGSFFVQLIISCCLYVLFKLLSLVVYLNKKSIILTCLFKSIAQSGLVRTKIEGLSTVVSLVAFKFKATGTWGSYADPT